MICARHRSALGIVPRNTAAGEPVTVLS